MATPLIKLTGSMTRVCKKDFGVFAPAFQKISDPIKELFLEKIREFKSKSSTGKISLSPELQKELNSDKQRIYQQYSFKPGEDISKFPAIKFTEPKIEVPIINK